MNIKTRNNLFVLVLIVLGIIAVSFTGNNKGDYIDSTLNLLEALDMDDKVKDTKKAMLKDFYKGSSEVGENVGKIFKTQMDINTLEDSKEKIKEDLILLEEQKDELVKNMNEEDLSNYLKDYNDTVKSSEKILILIDNNIETLKSNLDKAKKEFDPKKPLDNSYHFKDIFFVLNNIEKEKRSYENNRDESIDFYDFAVYEFEERLVSSEWVEYEKVVEEYNPEYKEWKEVDSGIQYGYGPGVNYKTGKFGYSYGPKWGYETVKRNNGEPKYISVKYITKGLENVYIVNDNVDKVSEEKTVLKYETDYKVEGLSEEEIEALRPEVEEVMDDKIGYVKEKKKYTLDYIERIEN